jgi:predicted RNA-binding Zn-ribbon protein involved in translation (DUF1610 family)
MAGLHMLLHPLAAGVKCPACGSDLVFVRVRGYGDLYQCSSGGLGKCQVMHYRRQRTQTCGYAILYESGEFGEWTACDMPAAKG